MKITLTLIFLLFSLSTFAQDIANNDNILYIVDSIPIIDDPDESKGTLKNEDIDILQVVTDTAEISKLGYHNINKVIFVTTKEFTKRPAEIRVIPSTNAMDQKKGLWYIKKSNTPYSGKFIDYFMNGKIQGEGNMKDGVVEGLRIVYYPNGAKSFFRNYVNGIANGYSEEYFQDGKIKQKGKFLDGMDEGLWQQFYSTGAIKRQTTFVNQQPVMTKDEKKFFTLQNEAVGLMKEDDYIGAIKKLDAAEKLNSNYADIYFYRGTAKMNKFDFDGAIIDFDKAVTLEPMYMEAIANRAFARLRKYEFKDSRTLSKTTEVTVMTTKDKVEIPADEKVKICSDLNKSVELGDTKPMIIDALKNYCQ